MTDLTHTPHYQSESPLKGLPNISILQLLLAGMYFVVGISGTRDDKERAAPARVRVVGRHMRRQYVRNTTRASLPNSRNISPLQAFLPRGLTHNQFSERCTRLSPAGRLRIYNFKYYRWEYYRIGAIRLRGRMLRSVYVRAITMLPCGLCDAHIAPD